MKMYSWLQAAPPFITLAYASEVHANSLLPDRLPFQHSEQIARCSKWHRDLGISELLQFYGVRTAPWEKFQTLKLRSAEAALLDRVLFLVLKESKVQGSKMSGAGSET